MVFGVKVDLVLAMSGLLRIGGRIESGSDALAEE